MKLALRYLLAFLVTFAGITHFTSPESFIRIVPAYLPSPALLVYLSGVFEILGGIGLLIPRLRTVAAWGLIALFIAVFPANINMAIHQIPFGDAPTPLWLLWARLPMQFVLIGWAYWVRK